MSLRKIKIVGENCDIRDQVRSFVDPSRYLVEEVELNENTLEASSDILPLFLLAAETFKDLGPTLMPLCQAFPVIVVQCGKDAPPFDTDLIHSGVQETCRLGDLSAEGLHLMIERAFARFGAAVPRSQHEQMFTALCDSLTFQMAYRIIVPPGRKARFVYVSSGVEHISGLRREEVLNDPHLLYRQIVDEDKKRLALLEEHAVATLTPLELEVRKIDKNGNLRWVHIRSFPSRGADGSVIWDGVESDITGYKLAEEEVRRLLSINQNLLESERLAREKSEQNSRMKDEFLASLSHELRTPINAVLGWTQLIQRGVLKGSEYDRAIDTIERNARIQAQMIADLLDMSRIISGKVQLEFDSIDIRHFMFGIIDTLNPSAESKQVKLNLDVDPGVTLHLSGERARLQQVFSNIISNAIKFTPEQGEVNVQVRQNNGNIQIAITDTGVGIKPEFLPMVFDRFRQADASFARKFGGLGLGLAIVKQLTELHRGTVTAWSAGEGHGSTFTVTLPGNRLDAPLPEERDRYKTVDAIDKTALKGRNIFLVDDEADALELARHILVEAGATVTTATSGQDALTVLGLDRTAFDVIISDIGMPEMDGMRLLGEIRKHFPRYLSTPAIALTAFARAEDRDRVLSAGYNLHLTKPVNAHELVESARSLSRRSQPELKLVRKQANS